MIGSTEGPRVDDTQKGTHEKTDHAEAPQQPLIEGAVPASPDVKESFSEKSE